MAEEVVSTEEEVSTPAGEEEITQDDKLWGALSWIWIVGLIMLLMEDKKKRPFIKYNAVSGLAYAVVWAVAWATVCGGLLGLVYMIFLAIKTYQGEWVEVPVITDFCKSRGWI